MRRIVCLMLSVVALSVLPRLTAQTVKQDAATGPKTKIESFQAQTGSVIITGYSETGTLMAQLGTQMSVEAREFTNAASGKKESGILIGVKQGGRLDHENSSYIDYDEIESLLRGIDYISKIQPSVTKLSSFQADYRTRGELEVSTYSTKGGIDAAVKSGRYAGVRAFLTLSDLQKFRDLVSEAKGRLDTLKSPQ